MPKTANLRRLKEVPGHGPVIVTREELLALKEKRLDPKLRITPRAQVSRTVPDSPVKGSYTKKAYARAVERALEKLAS